MKNTDRITEGERRTETGGHLMLIRGSYELFSETEKRIADYMLAEGAQVLDFSIHELARRTSTSPTTIVRFCRKIGFKGYAEFKFYMDKGGLASSGEGHPIEEGDGLPAICQKLLSFNLSVLKDTVYSLDEGKLDEAISLISRADTIYIYAEGGSGSIGSLAFYLFVNLGLKCCAYNDAFSQVLTAANLSERDVVLALSHSGRAYNTIDGVMTAKTRGTPSICIAGYADSPLAQICDVVLLSGALPGDDYSELPAARMSELMILSVLQAGIAGRRGDELNDRIANVRRAYRMKRS